MMMKKSIKMLNYIAFFLLYITSFVFMYRKFSEIIGWIVLFVTNGSFMAFIINDLMPYISGYNFFVPSFAALAVITTSVLYTVSLIFIIMMINNMQSKYKKAYGTPMVLPKEYSDSIEEFKRLTIATFCICILILLNLFYRIDYLNINFYEAMRNASFYTLYNEGSCIITILLSASAVIISSIQLSTANNYSKLTRQQLIV